MFSEPAVQLYQGTLYHLERVQEHRLKDYKTDFFFFPLQLVLGVIRLAQTYSLSHKRVDLGGSRRCLSFLLSTTAVDCFWASSLPTLPTLWERRQTHQDPPPCYPDSVLQDSPDIALRPLLPKAAHCIVLNTLSSERSPLSSWPTSPARAELTSYTFSVNPVV